MLRAAVSKIVRNMKEDPERGIKKLLEIAEKSASGKQKEILELVARELSDKNSAYYKLITDLIFRTDQRVLTEFGINLGYNGFTVGAEKINKLKQEKGHGIPWSIFFDMSWGSYPAMDTIAHIIRQGVDMGIHCYMFHIHRKYTGFDELMSILSSFPGCAFFMFLYTPAINERLVSRAISLKNVMLLLKPEDEPGKENQEAAKLLIQSGCLCGCFARYSSRGGPIRDDSFLIPAEKLGFSFMCMICNEKLRPTGGESMKRFVDNYRMDLKRPILPVDLWADMIDAGTSIGTGACLVTISGGDQIIITDYERRRNKGGIDIQTPLSSVLMKI
jgi:hypothetical protein